MRLRSSFNLLTCTVLVLLALLLPVTRASAQLTSSIQGRVTDTSDAAVPGATVTATNEATGVARSDVSNADGLYRLRDLPPGPYQVRVELVGFKALVKSNIVVTAQASLNIDAVLEVGDLAETVAVTAAPPQIETTESRISTVIDARSIKSLPSIGRSLMWMTMLAPGIQGKAEDGRQGMCCDSLGGNAAPKLSSGGNEDKSVFLVDGVALHYGDGAGWGLAFTPNPDAVEEVRVSTNPTSAADGAMGGVQVQMVTKGGSNNFHGTGHYTFLDDGFNALPYGASKADVGEWYQRYFGATLGGPVVSNRLFFFGAYEGLREKRSAAGGSTAIVETQAFADWVKATRPNSIAANLLTAYAPAKYATENLVDVNGDGIPDMGTIPVDRPSERTGNQVNGRIDYLTRSGKDRFYATFWRTTNSVGNAAARPQFDGITLLPAMLTSVVNTHAFTPSMLNDVRLSYWTQSFDFHVVGEPYNVPTIVTDDGLGLGNPGFSREVQKVHTWDFHDTFEWNKGHHNFKMGGAYRHVYVTDPAYSLDGDIPLYNFATIVDFANDNPYRETRVIDAATGALRDPFTEYGNQQLSFFFQNEWRMADGLTLNYGVRWDNYFNLNMTGFSEPTTLYQPFYTSAQVNAAGIPGIVNKASKDSYDDTLTNFGPRVSIAWDPVKSGKTVYRAGFFVLPDEIRSVGPYRDYYGNPPRSSQVQAGPAYGIPIVYTGVAPNGRDSFPVNPGLTSVAVDEALGIFAGTRPSISGFPRDFKTPKTYDVNAAVEHQLFADVAVSATYHYRHTVNEELDFDANRFNGDMVDGSQDRLNPYYSSITVRTNLGRRSYHGLSLTARKRWSSGLSWSASYGYNAGWDNLGVQDVFQPDDEWARVEGATHTFKAFTIWDLPMFRDETGLLGKTLGGWQLSTAWNLESGFKVSPFSGAAYGAGGDFNADGRQNDRPDLPTGSLPSSISNAQWIAGAFSASLFPLPTTVRNGTLPRNYLTGPGYARVDAGLSKGFTLRPGMDLRFAIQASNLFNRINISSVQSSLTAGNFGQANGFYPMRTVQLSAKVTF
jgi:hypothetical protein